MMDWKDKVMDDIALLTVNKELPLKGGSRWQGVKLGKYRSLVQTQAEISFPLGEVSVAKAVLAIIENPKQVNYRLKEITEYCETKVDSSPSVVV